MCNMELLTILDDIDLNPSTLYLCGLCYVPDLFDISDSASQRFLILCKFDFPLKKMILSIFSRL